MQSKAIWLPENSLANPEIQLSCIGGKRLNTQLFTARWTKQQKEKGEIETVEREKHWLGERRHKSGRHIRSKPREWVQGRHERQGPAAEPRTTSARSTAVPQRTNGQEAGCPGSEKPTRPTARDAWNSLCRVLRDGVWVRRAELIKQAVNSGMAVTVASPN